MNTAIALIISALCYAAAAAVAVLPLSRAVAPPVRAVVSLLGVGIVVHLIALAANVAGAGSLPFFGLGPALSLAGLALASSVLVVEWLAADTVLTLVGGPLAAAVTATGALTHGVPTTMAVGTPHGLQGVWLASHIIISFVGMAALATAAAAGTLYLVERRELKSRHFGSVFRAFPPLETLDRVNHVGAIIGCAGLTVGLMLAVPYTVLYGLADGPRVVWGLVAWLAATSLAAARLVAGWKARRAAVTAALAFAFTLAAYLAARVIAARPGQFL